MSQAVERTRIRTGGYKWLRGDCVKTNKAFSEIIVWLYVDLRTVKAWQAMESPLRCVFEFWYLASES